MDDLLKELEKAQIEFRKATKYANNGDYSRLEFAAKKLFDVGNRIQEATKLFTN